MFLSSGSIQAWMPGIFSFAMKRIVNCWTAWMGESEGFKVDIIYICISYLGMWNPLLTRSAILGPKPWTAQQSSGAKTQTTKYFTKLPGKVCLRHQPSRTVPRWLALMGRWTLYSLSSHCWQVRRVHRRPAVPASCRACRLHSPQQVIPFYITHKQLADTRRNASQEKVHLQPSALADCSVLSCLDGWGREQWLKSPVHLSGMRSQLRTTPAARTVCPSIGE